MTTDTALIHTGPLLPTRIIGLADCATIRGEQGALSIVGKTDAELSLYIQLQTLE